MEKKFKAIVIGVSAGGFKALHTILPNFPLNFPLPIFIVQHRVPGTENYLVESLDKQSKVYVKEGDDKESIQPGTVYLAPGGYHMLIEKDYTISLSVDEPVSFARPSIDVLFETAAIAYKEQLIGIILTGANSDGSQGIIDIKARGGIAIAQTPETAESSIMPLSAINTGKVDYVKTIDELVDFVLSLME